MTEQMPDPLNPWAGDVPPAPVELPPPPPGPPVLSPPELPPAPGPPQTWGEDAIAIPLPQERPRPGEASA